MVRARRTLDEANAAIIVQNANARSGGTIGIPAWKAPLLRRSIHKYPSMAPARRICEAAIETSPREMHPARDKNANLSGPSRNEAGRHFTSQLSIGGPCWMGRSLQQVIAMLFGFQDFAFERELFLHALSPSLPHTFRFLRVISQLLNGARQGHRICRSDEQPVVAVLYQFRNASHIGGNDRQGSCHGLQDGGG